jgi:hypothetical protein
MKKLFTKKFKTRVKHYINEKYTVQYCYYRFIPIWYSLMWFHSSGYHSGNMTGWYINLWDYESAEKIATKIKSIEDVLNYYKPFEEEEKKWEKAEQKYWEKNVPYNTKIINKS